MTAPARPGFEPGSWGPECCADCGGGLPRGLVKLGRDKHVDCDEARAAWRSLNEAGRAPITSRNR